MKISPKELSCTRYEKYDHVYEKYYNYTYKIVYNVLKSTADMEEVMQEIFLKVWVNLDVITDEVSAKAWISTVARNTAINFLNKKISDSGKTADISDEILMASASEGTNDPLDVVEVKDGVRRIFNVICKMKKKYADVLLLSIKNGETPEEIAVQLGRNIKTVYTQLERGRAMLRKELVRQKEVEMK